MPLSTAPDDQPDQSVARLEDGSHGVRILTLDRAFRLNALTSALVRQVAALLDEVAADRHCRALVLTGAGRAFSVGLDLQDYGDSERVAELGSPLAELERQRELAALTLRLHRLPQTVVAAVNGPAAGGGFALVCASDLRIAARSARFGVSFIRAGFSACDLGVSWLLPRLVGASRAHELMLTGRLFGADEARDMGLVVDVVDDAALLDAALAKAAEVALNPPASVELTKQGMWLALELPSLEAAIELENRQQVLAGLTADRHEATAAFLEKRPPHYQHR